MIRDIDPIDLEVLRSRLESIGEQACRAVEQTAISPNVTEAKEGPSTMPWRPASRVCGLRKTKVQPEAK